jgi:DNA-binding NtrC family response regulator
LGAADYLTKPFEIERLRAIARRTADRVALERHVHDLQSQLDEKTAYGAVVGVSRAIRDLFGLMARAGPAPVDVLIRGETGSGKELIARELHRLSPRARGPFVPVNVAAIAETLTESELFGHVRGAFTGAEHDRPGVFSQAHGGTLFLDEIGDMSASAQAKILRVLQDRVVQVQPVGSIERRSVDVRVISATHRNLEEAVAQGLFRQDLYYRIQGVELIVPPLRQRPEDILLLANYFLERYAVRSGVAACKLSADAAEALLAYPWPGNIRELEHLVTSSAVLGAESMLRAADLRLPNWTSSSGDSFPFHSLAGLPLTEAKAQLVETFERSAIEAALRAHKGNISAAARQLGIHRQSLQQKMTQLRIDK